MAKNLALFLIFPVKKPLSTHKLENLKMYVNNYSSCPLKIKLIFRNNEIIIHVRF